MTLRNAKETTYIMDDGREAYALVKGEEPDGTLNLAVLDPDDYSWHAANKVPLDRTKS
jgi:hypothetical protein